MTVLELIGLLDQLLFVGLFVVVLLRALRLRTRASLNVALLFGSVAAFLAVLRAVPFVGPDERLVGLAVVFLNMAPLAMLRLVDDFSDSPRWVQRAGIGAFGLVSTVALLRPEVGGSVVELATIGFFLTVGGYAAFVFAAAGARARGITRRRMIAVAIGAILFIVAIVAVFLAALLPETGPPASATGLLLALAASIAFLLGFTPPAWIRRAWREPDLRQFLEQSPHLVTMPDDHRAMLALARSVADAFGATGASVGLADSERGLLRYASRSGEWLEHPADELIAGRAFTSQRRIVVLDAAEADPAHAETYREVGARTVIAAPVTAEDRRLGVLSVYAERAPIFVEDDVWLIELLADQTAVLLEARALARQVSELRAREEAARLKEEFLSAAAHDLRTPLTVVLGQAELLERRAARQPRTPIDPAGLTRIVREARRLRDLVNELLDAQRLEQGGVLGALAPADVGDLAEAVVHRYAEQGSRVTLARPDVPLVVPVDRGRMEQVIENLVENALKYGPRGGVPEVVVGADDRVARISIMDHGIGVPLEEQERIFERFYRGSNVHGVTQTGLGLGLYICRQIVEAHGGSISCEATAGGGTTFVVTLPLPPRPDDPGPIALDEVPADLPLGEATAGV